MLSLLTGGMAQLVTKEGGIEWVIQTVQKFISGKRSAKIGIGLLVSLADIAVANNTVCNTYNRNITKKISEKYEVDAKRKCSV